MSGRSLSEWHEEHGFQEKKHEATFVALDHTPAELTTRITARSHAWIEGGWIEETRRLIAMGFGESRAMASVGYKEVHAHVEGRLSEAELELTVVRATRVFARRQRTWLNGVDVNWV